MTKRSHWNICSITWALAVGIKGLTEKSYHLCKSLFLNVPAKTLDLQPPTERKEHLLFLLPCWGSVRGVFSWQAACSYHLNERRLWSESLCFELCIWDMVQRSTLQPMTELQGFKCWAVFVKGTVNSPKRRPSSQVIPHDKYNFCNASLHFKRTRSQ